jgi:hypothetical protein
VSGGAQTALVVGGVAVGAFVLLKVFAPPPAVVARPRSNTDTISLNSIIGLGTSLAGLFGGGGGSAVTPVTTVDTYQQAQYGLSHGVVDQVGNQLIDLNTGNALDFGPY